MEKQIVLLDTSILIDYFRKTDKSNAILTTLILQFDVFVLSSITIFEIFTGAHKSQISFWDEFLAEMTVLSFDNEIARFAAKLNTDFKSSRNQINMADLFIAATALKNDLPLATLNTRHFQRIKNSILI